MDADKIVFRVAGTKEDSVIVSGRPIPGAPTGMHALLRFPLCSILKPRVWLGRCPMFWCACQFWAAGVLIGL